MAKKERKSILVNENDYLKVEADENWLHDTVGKGFYDLDFFRIIDFFVLHSPCKESSYSPKTLESLGWKNPWHSRRFRDTFDGIPGFADGKSFFFHENKNHFLKMWNTYGIALFPGDEEREYAVLTYAGESNPRMDLLHHIRNAFAHGRFAVKKTHGEYYIYLEDVGTIRQLSGIFVMARICLKKATLIRWIDLFERKSENAKRLYSLYSVSED